MDCLCFDLSGLLYSVNPEKNTRNLTASVRQGLMVSVDTPQDSIGGCSIVNFTRFPDKTFSFKMSLKKCDFSCFEYWGNQHYLKQVSYRNSSNSRRVIAVANHCSLQQSIASQLNQSGVFIPSSLHLYVLKEEAPSISCSVKLQSTSVSVNVFDEHSWCSRSYSASNW